MRLFPEVLTETTPHVEACDLEGLLELASNGSQRNGVTVCLTSSGATTTTATTTTSTSTATTTTTSNSSGTTTNGVSSISGGGVGKGGAGGDDGALLARAAVRLGVLAAEEALAKLVAEAMASRSAEAVAEVLHLVDVTYGQVRRRLLQQDRVLPWR